MPTVVSEAVSRRSAFALSTSSSGGKWAARMPSNDIIALDSVTYAEPRAVLIHSPLAPLDFTGSLYLMKSLINLDSRLMGTVMASPAATSSPVSLHRAGLSGILHAPNVGMLNAV